MTDWQYSRFIWLDRVERNFIPQTEVLNLRTTRWNDVWLRFEPGRQKCFFQRPDLWSNILYELAFIKTLQLQYFLNTPQIFKKINISLLFNTKKMNTTCILKEINVSFIVHFSLGKYSFRPEPFWTQLKLWKYYLRLGSFWSDPDYSLIY